MKIRSLIKIYFICFFIIGCANKEEIALEDTKNIVPEDELKKENPKHADAFYPLKESMEDLQYQINLLKAQVQEYESTLHAPTLNAEILKLIKSPKIEHEILIENGTIIQGIIINEDADKMIVQTQIGQLKIDKTLVKSIKNVEPLIPKVEFKEESIEEKISLTNLAFSGEVINMGARRGDFVRVIYNLWESETKFLLADSVFIAGSSVIYNNNVISNSCLEPGGIGTFNLSINIPDSIVVSYWTKDIQSSIFE